MADGLWCHIPQYHISCIGNVNNVWLMLHGDIPDTSKPGTVFGIYISGIDYIYNLDCEYTRLSFIRSALVTDST